MCAAGVSQAEAQSLRTRQRRFESSACAHLPRDAPSPARAARPALAKKQPMSLAQHLAIRSDSSVPAREHRADEPHAHESLVDVAQRIDPSHGFLAQVAPLGEADRLAVATDLLRQIVLVEINAKQRRPASIRAASNAVGSTTTKPARSSKSGRMRRRRRSSALQKCTVSSLPINCQEIDHVSNSADADCRPQRQQVTSLGGCIAKLLRLRELRSDRGVQ